MPNDYRLAAEANLLGLAKIGFELNTILYDYNVNSSIDAEIFNKAIVTVLPEADNKDSIYWLNVQTIPNTDEELSAYKRIDSIRNTSTTFWDNFSILSDRINFDESFSVSGPLTIYHFNRVEGHSFDLGFYLDDVLNKRSNSSLAFSYGLSDKKIKTDFHTDYSFGKYRTYNLSLNVFNRLNVLFKQSETYNELTATFLSLFYKYEFRDYYYSKGFKINFSGEVLPVLSLNLGFNNHTDKNAFVNTQFSLFSKDKIFRSNQKVNEFKINALTAGFKVDFRDYIEDGIHRRRTTFGRDFIIFEGGLTFSHKEIKSSVNFIKYEFKTFSAINTFRSANLNLKLFVMYTQGSLPFQLLYSLPGNIDLTAQNYSFRTLEVNEILGDRIVTLHIEHNFNDEIFRLLNIPGLKDWELRLNSFINIGYADAGNQTKTILPVSLRYFKHPFYEIGFGIGQVLIPLQLEFAWKLNYKDGNNLRFGINTFLY
jgi:hypothetical protein